MNDFLPLLSLPLSLSVPFDDLVLKLGSKTHTSAFVGTNLHKEFSFSYCYARNRHHHHEGIILFILFIITLSSSAFPGIHSVKVGSFLKLWKGKSRVRERGKLELEEVGEKERFRKVKQRNDDPF